MSLAATGHLNIALVRLETKKHLWRKDRGQFLWLIQR